MIIFEIMRRLLSLTLSLLIAAWACAQKATVEKVWIDHGQERNGEKGMLIHVKFQVDNAKGHKVYVQGWIQSPKDTYVSGTKSDYTNGDGYFISRSYSTATYVNTVWNDYTLWMPYSAFKMKAGKNDYFVRIDVYDATLGKHITVSPGYCAFVGTGSSNQQAQVDNSNGNGNSWRKTTPNGYEDWVKNADGSYSVTSVTKCLWCHGSTVCCICNGMGGTYGRAYGGMWYPCKSCAGTKVCQNCHGKGKSILVSRVANGVAVGYDQNGRMFTGGGGSSSGGSSSRRSSSSNSSNDYIETIEYAPNYTGSDNVWSDKCQKVAPRHSHIRKRVR